MLAAFGISDPGLVRTNNEDYYLVLPDRGLYVVADGMGGAQAGEHASRLAADTVADVLRDPSRSGADDLCKAFEEANNRVRMAASEDAALDGMGTTLVAAMQAEPDILIASVGDSRAYVFAEGRLLIVTQDQTWIEEVGRKLGIDEVSLKNHPMRHVLTMAIGVSSQLRVHSYALHPMPGMQILLCSDGLHGVVEPEVIADALARDDDSLEARCRRLVAAAKAKGAPDNITAVLIECRG